MIQAQFQAGQSGNTLTQSMGGQCTLNGNSISFSSKQVATQELQATATFATDGDDNIALKCNRLPNTDGYEITFGVITATRVGAVHSFPDEL